MEAMFIWVDIYCDSEDIKAAGVMRCTHADDNAVEAISKGAQKQMCNIGGGESDPPKE